MARVVPDVVISSSVRRNPRVIRSAAAFEASVEDFLGSLPPV